MSVRQPGPARVPAAADGSRRLRHADLRSVEVIREKLEALPHQAGRRLRGCVVDLPHREAKPVELRLPPLQCLLHRPLASSEQHEVVDVANGRVSPERRLSSKSRSVTLAQKADREQPCATPIPPSGKRSLHSRMPGDAPLKSSTRRSVSNRVESGALPVSVRTRSTTGATGTSVKKLRMSEQKWCVMSATAASWMLRTASAELKPGTPPTEPSDRSTPGGPPSDIAIGPCSSCGIRSNARCTMRLRTGAITSGRGALPARCFSTPRCGSKILVPLGFFARVDGVARQGALPDVRPGGPEVRLPSDLQAEIGLVIASRYPGGAGQLAARSAYTGARCPSERSESSASSRAAIRASPATLAGRPSSRNEFRKATPPLVPTRMSRGST